MVLGGDTFAKYASGFLLYYREGSLMAQAFDPKRGQLKGDPPRRVAEHVAPGYYQTLFDASENRHLDLYNEQRSRREAIDVV